MTQTLVSKAIQDFLMSLEDEPTEFWVIVNDLKTSDSTLSLEKITSLSKVIVRELIEKYGVKEMDPMTRMIFDLSPDQAVEKVDEIFIRSRGRLPTIGDGLWLTR